MNALSAFASQEVWHIAGWTMLHYLWLGTLIGIIAILCRLILRRAAANLRYTAALACLFVLAALPVGIATWLVSYPPPLKGGVRGGMPDPVATIKTTSPDSQAHPDVIDLRDQQLPSVAAAVDAESGNVLSNAPKPEPSPNPSLKGRGIDFTTFEALVPYLPWLWVVGTPITFTLLAAGLVGAKRLQRTSRAIDDPRIGELLARLRKSLRIGKCVTVAVCDRIASPVLVGIVRPMILLPPAALTGWSPDEIEMVLLHELAHVRRWDNLVNLLQRLIESLLFFHPAVWLVSTWVRRERESCCDAFVIRRTERPHAYAELLVALASQMPRSVLFHPAATSAMSAGPLRSRIRRILQLEDDPMLISGKSLALMLATLFIAATLAVLYVPTIGQAEESTTEVAESTEGKAGTDKQKNKNSSSTGSSTNSEAELKQENAKEPQVVATLPPDALSTPAQTNAVPKAFLAAYAAAREKKHYVELLDRKDDLTLVVVPQPNDSNWPDVLGDSPRKDRVIAEKAYARLGLKLAPLTRAEVTFRRFTNQRLGVQIVGGIVPKGLPLPSLLTTIDDHDISSMDGLLQWLESIPGKGTTSVKCNALDDGNEYLFDAARQPSPPTPAAKKPQPQPAGKAESPLQPAPTDRVVVAYEVPDALNADVRQFIQNTGLRGLWDKRGRVVFQAAPQQHEQFLALLDSTSKWREAMKKRQPGSPPTPNFIIRKVDGEDVLEWPTAGLTFKRGTQPGFPGVAVVEVAPGSPAAWQDIRSGDILTTLEEFGTGNLAELESILKTLMSSFPDPGKQVTAEFMRFLNNTPQLHRPTELPLRLNDDGSPPPKRSTTGEREFRRQQAMQTAAMAEQQRSTAERSTKNAQQPNFPTKQNKPPLRYDGKTFDDWRTEWQTELSTKKRLDAVIALAAFGRAGYDKEAADAILDVAGEYDFKTIDNTGEGSIKNAVLNHLAPYGQAQPMATHWVPSLVARLAKEPRKWQSLAIQLLLRLQTEDKDTIAIIRSLAETGPEGVRRAALGALVRSNRLRSGGPQIDDTTQALLTASLKSKDPAEIGSALNSLYYQSVPGGAAQLVFQPELVALLFHSDKSVQQSARSLLTRIQDADAPQVVKPLLAILQDDSRKPDHLAAIRALGTIGPKADAAQPQLEQIFAENSQDMPILVAAAFAVDRIEDGSRLHNKLNDIVNKATEEKTQTKLIQLMNAEPQYFE